MTWVGHFSKNFGVTDPVSGLVNLVLDTSLYGRGSINFVYIKLKLKKLLTSLSVLFLQLCICLYVIFQSKRGWRMRFCKIERVCDGDNIRRIVITSL